MDVPHLITAYYSFALDAPGFGTARHRGSVFDRAFNEAHILGLTQALFKYRGE